MWCVRAHVSMDMGVCINECVIVSLRVSRKASGATMSLQAARGHLLHSGL